MKKALKAISQWALYMAYQPIAVAAAIVGASLIIVALVFSFKSQYEWHHIERSGVQVFDKTTGKVYTPSGWYNRVDGDRFVRP